MENNINSVPISSSLQKPNVCAQCGSSLGEDQVFCPNCGARKQQLPPNRNCFNCGAQVPQGVAFCPSCGAKIGDNPCEVNPAIAQFNDKLTTTKKKKTVFKKVITTIVVSVLVVAILGGGVYFFGIPYYNYKVACDALYNGEYDDAYQAFVDLNGFMDSRVMANEALYLKAKALLKDDKFDQAIAIFEDIEEYEDSAEMITEAQYQKACSYLEKKNYSQAILLFEKIGYYKDSKDKIKEAKYGYVLAHKNNADRTTYDYLLSLKSAYYKDSATIYKNLYEWKITVLGWNSDSDSDNYLASISKYRAVICHFKLSGGTPDEKITIRASSTLPSGNTTNYTFDSEWEDGWSGWYGWEDGIYTYPEYGDTGTLRVYFYDEYGNQIGSGSIKITN